MGKDTARREVQLCPACGTVISPRFQQCPMCDARLTGPCPQCGNSDAPPQAETCGQCGLNFLQAPPAGG